MIHWASEWLCSILPMYFSVAIISVQTSEWLFVITMKLCTFSIFAHQFTFQFVVQNLLYRVNEESEFNLKTSWPCISSELVDGERVTFSACFLLKKTIATTRVKPVKSHLCFLSSLLGNTIASINARYY